MLSKPQPKGTWGAIIGLAIIMLGMGIGLTSKLSTVTCNRVEIDSITCSAIEEDLLEFNTEQTTLEKLQRAEVRVRIKLEGDAEKVVLVGEKQEVKLKAFDGEAQEAAAKINDFITDLNEESVILRQDDRWFSCFFGIVLVIAGLFQTGLLKVSTSRRL